MRILLRKFWGVIPWMLELAVIIDMVLGRWVEAIVIAALLVFNAFIGFRHEGQAQRALALLRQRLMAPISPSLIGGKLLLGVAFPVGADLLKVALTRSSPNGHR